MSLPSSSTAVVLKESAVNSTAVLSRRKERKYFELDFQFYDKVQYKLLTLMKEKLFGGALCFDWLIQSQVISKHVT